MEFDLLGLLRGLAKNGWLAAGELLEEVGLASAPPPIEKNELGAGPVVSALVAPRAFLRRFFGRLRE
ncbi:MAG: hypothetical protein ACYDG0_02100 [Vulcanimicrobiaceae bacterium]